MHIDGRDVTGITGHAGYMLQKDLLLPWRTVIENIRSGALYIGRRARRSRARRAVALLERYGLGGFEHTIRTRFPAACASASR